MDATCYSVIISRYLYLWDALVQIIDEAGCHPLSSHPRPHKTNIHQAKLWHWGFSMKTEAKDFTLQTGQNPSDHTQPLSSYVLPSFSAAVRHRLFSSQNFIISCERCYHEHSEEAELPASANKLLCSFIGPAASDAPMTFEANQHNE